MEKILFITNKIYIDKSNREGGVSNCTNEFIEFISQKFKTVLFGVEYKHSFIYKLRVKFGINHYNDYRIRNYKSQLKKIIKENNIRFVFLNLSNSVTFSTLIKNLFSNKVKIILCSHGNESGDYLHQVVKFKKDASWLKKLISSYSLGKLIKKESYYRIKYLDMVLCISSVEEQIEKWIGAKNTFMVPRIIRKEFLNLNPVLNRVGFFGDLSHTPNYTALISLCNSISNNKFLIELRLTGGPEKIGEKIAKQFPFIKYLGFLSNTKLKEEVSTWAYFLNLVFYYSRGVSTKLAKALGWGLPVISTIPGNRGYIWKKGKLLIAKDENEMAKMIVSNAGKLENIMQSQIQTQDIVSSTPTYGEIMAILYPKLLAL